MRHDPGPVHLPNAGEVSGLLGCSVKRKQQRHTGKGNDLPHSESPLSASQKIVSGIVIDVTQCCRLGRARPQRGNRALERHYR